MKNRTIALVGNPNCGKTTLFNVLTGSSQRVGNWPGVTVERLEGHYSHGGTSYNVIDLPGIYSFSAYSEDEKVAREFILRDKPDLVINILDASNLERNLYLTTQLLEMKVPVLVVLNMMDVVEERRITIEIDHLAEHLDVSVIPVSASRKKGIDQLKESVAKEVDRGHLSSVQIEYDEVVERAIESLCCEIAEIAKKEEVDKRWLAIKLLEKDALANEFTNGAFAEKVEQFSAKIAKHTGEPADIMVADGRYGFIHGLAHDVINRDAELSRSITDTIDRIVLNRFFGIPVFIVVMFIMFTIIMNFGAPFIDFFDILGRTIFVDGVRSLLTGVAPEWVISLLADGLGAGIETVATFIPPIALIFLCLSFLEDSGYMSRASFVMDRFLRAIGLPGKAFIPMLVGFGCNVPGILATRTLEGRRDRILAILINPFMSCGAKLPVYALFTAAFFRESAALVLFCLYFAGVTTAVITALFFGKTILKGNPGIFVMELPPYHIPTLNGILFHTWNRLKSFIFRAGQAIIVIVVVMTLLKTVGTDGSLGNENNDKSLLVVIGKKITPVFTPMGVQEDNWPATVALFTGVFAKEAVVGTITSLYLAPSMKSGQAEAPPVSEKVDAKTAFWRGIADAFKAIPDGFRSMFSSNPTQGGGGDSSISAALRRHFGNRRAVLGYLLFVLLYCPCLATVAATYSEIGFKWALFSVLYQTLLAWIVATSFYQFTCLTSDPATALLWLAVCIAAVSTFIFAVKRVKVNVS